MKRIITLLILLVSLPGLVASAAASEAGEIRVEGVIELLTDTEIQVGGTLFQLNSGTEYEGENDEVLTKSDFTVGDYVEVKGLDVSGILVAREVEKDSPDDSSDDDDNSSGSGDDDDDDDDDDSSSNDDDDDSSSSDDDDSSSSGSDKSDKAKKDKKNSSDKSSNSGSRVKVKDKLKLDGLRLEIRRNAKLNKKGRGIDRIDVKLKVDLPSPLPAIADAAAAALADLRITFSREGEAFATCAFDFTGLDDSSDSDDSLRAHFRIRIKDRKKPSGDVSTDKNGLCDTDMVTSGDQPGVAAIERGDTYSVYEVTETADNEFLAGEL